MMKFCNCNAFRYPEKPSSVLNINVKEEIKPLKRNHRAVFGGGWATHNSLIAKVCKGLKNKFNRLFDEESNSNILHGYNNSHSERSEESPNFLCSTLAGEPKSLISKGGKISPCSGLLRHSVVKTSHLDINIPRNDSEVCSLPPLWGRVRGRGQMLRCRAASVWKYSK